MKILAYYIFFIITVILSFSFPIYTSELNHLGQIKIKYFKHLFLLLCFVVLFVGLRDFVGKDFSNYVSNFRLYKIESYKSRLEPGYGFINKVAIFLGFNYWFVFLSCALICNFLVFKALDEVSPYFFLSVIILFGIEFFFRQMNIVRQYVAVACFFYAIKYIIKNDIKKYILFILIGSSFHITCLMMIPFYWILKFKFSKIIFFIFLLCGLYVFLEPAFYRTLFYSISSFFPQKISNYLNIFLINNAVYTGGIRMLAETLLAILILLFIPKRIYKDPEMKVYINMFFLAFIMQVFLGRLYAISRLPTYLLVTQSICIPKFLNHKTIKNANKIIIGFLIILYYLFFAFVAIQDYSKDTYYIYNSVISPF